MVKVQKDGLCTIGYEQFGLQLEDTEEKRHQVNKL